MYTCLHSCGTAERMQKGKRQDHKCPHGHSAKGKLAVPDEVREV